MKIYLVILFTCSLAFSIQAQNINLSTKKSKSYRIVRSNIGAAGSSKVIKTAKGNYTVSQSIGQSSVVGTHHNNGYYLRQGYQQPSDKIKIIKEFSSSQLKAIIYPNPFEKSVLISFNEAIESEISVLVFDISGKMIYSQKFGALQSIELNLDDISQGTYLLKVLSTDKIFSTKLIKI